MGRRVRHRRFEDAPAGVAAGRAAGATVLAVLTSHPPGPLAAAHHIVGDLTRVTAAAEGLHVDTA